MVFKRWLGFIFNERRNRYLVRRAVLFAYIRADIQMQYLENDDQGLKRVSTFALL